MPLDPRLQPMVDAANAAPPVPSGLSVDELRGHMNAGMEETYLALSAPGPDVASTRDYSVPVEGGVIGLRVYTPEATGPLPAHLYIHGGAWWIGTVSHFDSVCRWTAAGAECVVASVDYRLAPEHKFPTAPEDCYAALCWLVDHADELGVDTARVSIGGGSAGANLAAAVALMARDRGGPSLVLQVLELPPTDLTLSHPSMTELGEGYVPTKVGMEQSIAYYLADPADALHPYASPIYAVDLSGLPPALVITAEFDPLRDEGDAYATRLSDAGVPTELKQWPGQIHGSHMLDELLPAEAEEYRELVRTALRTAYAR